jgi:hypothetical protein
VLDQANHPISGASVSIEADMSHPGMKPLFASAAAISADNYQADLSFDMPGDWILSVTANGPGGVHGQRQLNLTVKEK